MAEQRDRYTLTSTGYEQLQHELAQYQERRDEQQRLSSDLQDDRDEQFPEEGAEFETRTTREFLDERIGNLTLILENAEIIADDPDPRTIDPGDRVTLWNVTDREEQVYDLIGSPEAMYGREGVSIESPVGQALLGRRIGDVVDVETPDGTTRYAVRRIERTPAPDAEDSPQ